jgi:hypothetical protein
VDVCARCGFVCLCVFGLSVCLLACPFVCSFVRLFVCSFVRVLIRPFVPSFARSFKMHFVFLFRSSTFVPSFIH